MFSVLIRYKNGDQNGREVLIPARTVEYVPKGGANEPGILINHAVEAEGGCHLSPSEDKDRTWRDVFVMNAAGQTVARYTL